MSVELILRHATTQRWWDLADGHVRVAFALLSQASRSGAMTAEFTVTEIAASCGSDRSAVRRALDALVTAGFCTVSTSRGRHGTTTATLISPAHLITPQKRAVGLVSVPFTTINHDPLETSNQTVSISLVKDSELVEKSLADHGDLGHLKPPNPAISNSEFVGLPTEFAVFPALPSRAPDLDLLRSSDLRSSDLEILVDQRRSDPPARTQRESAAAVTRFPQETMDSHPPAANPTDSVTAEPASPHKPKRRTDPSKVPEKAWAAADYLRDQTLAKNGAAVVGVKPWESGWSWATGKMARTGDGSRNGLRLSWANSFRLFHASLKIALANGGQPSTDEYAWDEIAKTIFWLFHKQPTGVGFVVECPDTLRDKWDRIQACRTSMRQPGRSMSPPPTGDESACAGRVLSKLGVKAKVSFSSLPQHVELITHQIRSGVSERDLEAVVAYCDDLWRQPEMRKNLRPETLFGANTIARYLDAARTKYARQITSGSEIGGRAVPRSDDDDAHPIHPIMGGMFPE